MGEEVSLRIITVLEHRACHLTVYMIKSVLKCAVLFKEKKEKKKVKPRALKGS